MGSGTLPEIIVCEHSSLCHPQMQVKAPSGREEAICEHDPETLPEWQSWTKAHLKQTETKWKTVLLSDSSKFEIILGK